MWNLAKDTISHSDIEALADWLGTYPQLTQGDMVRRFEEAWSEWLGVSGSVLMSSGTTANFALMAVVEQRLKRKPRVGVAAVTWPTNVTPSILLGHELVVFDVDRRTLGVNEEQVCAAMRRREIDILFVTHLLGLNALTDQIIETARDKGVILLEDCCEAHGAYHGNQKVGTFGLGSTFSFYFGHHMSTIEGGMVSTNDPGLADELRRFRAHGQPAPGVFSFVSAGLNFRSTEINAFLGLRQLKRLDQRIEQRNRNMETFLSGIPSWLWSDFRTEGMSSFALPLIAKSTTGAVIVKRVVERLGIESRPVVAGNIMRQPFMRDYQTHPMWVADEIHDRGIYVGNGPHVNLSMVEALTGELTDP